MQTSRRNIVFVNFNYRVGLWGFLAGKELQEDGDINVGLLDQRFLLNWVKAHIAVVRNFSFGITLTAADHGSSAVTLITSLFKEFRPVRDR